MTRPSAPATAAPPTPVGRRATRIALVGSGFIADVHLQVLRAVPSVQVVALCDTQRARAERLAARHRIGAVCDSVDELLLRGDLDAVHVLVPPAAHADVAAACLSAGLHVLVEKPLVLGSAQVGHLEALAEQNGRVLGVNHNQAFHPAVQRLQNHVSAGRLGRLEHVSLQHHVPLRQLRSGDVSHFMFETDANILLEQGVHLFSVVFALLGACRKVGVVTGARRELPNGVRFVTEWNVALECERGTAAVRMAFGAPWLETTVQAIGTDGSALLDLHRGACWLRRKTRWLDFLDHGRNLAAGSLHLGARATLSVVGYGLGLFRLRFPDDPFLRSMRASLRGFHAAVRGSGTLADVASSGGARAVLEMCEATVRAAGLDATPPARFVVPAPGPARAGEVVVLGGTGFLGRRCVRLLRAAGRPVTIVVRRPWLLPSGLRDGSVRIVAGDAADPAVLGKAFLGAARVLHLATAAGEDPAAVELAMVTAVRAAADAALAARVQRLVYASSTAALWLGYQGTVTGAGGPDRQPATRGPYARGKIAAERALADARRAGLDVTIVRPAIVVGPDGPLEHSGIGLWVRDNHCVGWGRGDHGLPLVLADDCAAALVAALDAPAAGGKDYNLAGPVRLSAREFVAEMATRTGRDYRFHPTALWWMWLQEVGKYFVKALAMRPREWPSYRDLRSRGFRTELDCRDAEADLGFAPETDRARFLQRVFDAPART